MTKRTNKSEYTQALDVLSRSLALRDHSRLELQEKLSRRFAPELVEQVMNEADGKGWLLPERDIAARAALTWQRKLKSRRYIEAQLLKRGLPVPDRDDEAELETVRSLVEKKFGLLKCKEDRAQAQRYLKYRGFDDRTIRMVLNAKS